MTIRALKLFPITAILLSGCASQAINYTPPANVDLAEINIKLDLQNTIADPYYAIKDPETCPTTQEWSPLGRLDADSVKTSANIPAGKPILFVTSAFQVAVYPTPGYQCLQRVLFTPKPGEKYEIQSSVGWFPSGNRTQKARCDAVIYQINQDGTKVLEQSQQGFPADVNVCELWDSYKAQH